MTTPIWKLQRELEYARAREAFYNDTTRPIKTTVDAQPRIPVVYYPLFIKVGTSAPPFKLFASQKAVTKFGGAGALGLIDEPTTVAVAENPGRSFEPCKIHMMVGDATPTAVRAFNGSGRRYVRYAGTTTGDAQSHFTAPLGSGDSTPTIATVETKLGTVTAAKKGEIGTYGRIWFELEVYRKSVA